MRTSHRAKDHELVTLCRIRCRQLFVVFHDGDAALGLDEFLEQAGLTDRNVVAFLDRRSTWFLEGYSEEVTDVAAYVGMVQTVLDVADTFAVGLGRGGWAALYYARQIKAKAAWALEPSLPDPESLTRLESEGFSPRPLSERLAGAPGLECRVILSEGANSFAGSLGEIPGVKLQASNHGGGCLLTHLTRSGELRRLFPARTCHE